AAMFELGMMGIESKMKVNSGPDKAAAKAKLKGRRDRKLAKAPPAARAQLDADRDADRVDNENVVENLLSMIGDADDVASALATIPECGASAPTDTPLPDCGDCSIESTVALQAWNGQYAAAEDTGA